MARSKSSAFFGVSLSLEATQALRSYAAGRKRSPPFIIREALFELLRREGIAVSDYNPEVRGDRTDLRYPTREEIEYQLSQIDKRRKEKGNKS